MAFGAGVVIGGKGFFARVGAAIAGFFSSIPTWVKWTVRAAVIGAGVKGFMDAKDMMSRGQDILANKVAAGGKLPVIYGCRRVGAQIIYMDVNSNDSRDLYVVYALAVGECEEIIGRTIELDGNPLTDSARFRDGGYIGTDKISSGNGSLNSVTQNGTDSLDLGGGNFGTSPTAKYRYVMNLHHGAASQTADPMLVASMTNWTSAHRLDGVAYIAAHYGYDKEGMWSGVPQLTVQVKGKKVFDPRDTNQTFGTVSTYEWSDNPSLTFLDFITNDEYGKGLPIAKVNTTTFTTAANVADTLVDNPYYNGSAKTIQWSGNSGDSFITIPSGQTDAGIRWWQNKVGEKITLTDTAGNVVLNGIQVKAVERTRYYGAALSLTIYISATLGATYSTQTGTILSKIKRFHCNGYLDANKTVMDNAKELLANMRGIFTYVDGVYELQIEDTGSSTFSITDDHIISETGIEVNYGSKDDRANKVIVEFYNSNKKYELDTAIVKHDSSPHYYSDDGEILEVKATFPYITDAYIAHNLGKAILTRSRNQTTMTFLGTPEMYKLNVGDIVDLTYAGLGFSGKVCRVEAIELQTTGLVAISLIEYFDVYTWEVPAQEPLEELSDLPSAYAVAAPAGLAFTDTSSSSTGRPFLAWNTPTDFPDYQYRINVVDSSGNQVVNKIVDVANCDLNFAKKGTNYVASVSSLNPLGSESSAATLTFTVGNEPVGSGDIQANVITATEINVANLAAISADLGSITAGSMNIGSGNFTVSSSGVMTCTGATVSGAITASSLNVTGATVTGTLDASVITLNGEPLNSVLTYSEPSGVGLLTLNEDAAIDGDIVLSGTQPDLIVGKVTGTPSTDTVQADVILKSSTGAANFKIESASATKVLLQYDATTKTTLDADSKLTIKTGSSTTALTLDSSQDATFAGEVFAPTLVIGAGAPASASSTGTTGQIQFDTNYLYVCVDINTWKRVALSTW